MNVHETHESIAPLLPAYELNLLLPDERELIESHIRQCDECFESLYQFMPIRSSLLQMKHSETAKLPAITQRPRRQWLLAVVMAMLLVMSLWLIRQSSKLQQEIMQGAAQIQLQSPADKSEAESPVAFRWEDEPEAEFYKIYVFKNELIFVSGERVDSPEYLWIPPESAKPGKYKWKVESYFSDGTRIRDSVTFEIKLKK
jgi:hypothetical protein